jgi:choice-of-anchor A domain-containing protein
MLDRHFPQDSRYMKKIIIAAIAGLFFAQPAVAVTTLGDFDVYADGSVHIAGGGYGNIGAGSFTNANGPTGKNYDSVQASAASLTAQAAALSNAFAAMTTTGTFSQQWGAGTLTGTQSGTNVFTISVDQFQPLYKLTFAGLGDGAIVNITGSGSLMTSIQFDLGALTDPSQVVLNFVDLDNLWFNGLKFNGSILAPDAAVNIYGNSVAGSVIAKSFNSAGTFFGGTPYSGFTPAEAAPAVPEPSTWLLLILGFGMVGAAMRRRAASGAGLATA